ncbi:hypothetical protein BKA56DRAFT_436535, partial [Ilyonectria sp. MPI-CAGE-AT-0026]
EHDCLETHDRQEVPPDALHTLAPGTWLNDKAVYFVLLLIASAVPKTFTVIDPILSKPESGCSIATHSHLTVLAPINLSNNHWALVVIYGDEKRADVYDSMTNPDNTEWIHLSVKGLIPRLFPTAVSSDWKITNQPTPSQPNFDDCGVIVLIIALY